MKENMKTDFQAEGMNESGGCNCEGNCCPPEKKSILPKIIFATVLIAAIGIILFKSLNPSPSAPATDRQAFRDPNSPAWSDSAKSSCCDTAKASSCCPK